MNFLLDKAEDRTPRAYPIIVYGTIAGKPTGDPLKYEYERYKITYECKRSKIPDKSATPLPGNKYPPIDAFAIYKSKVKWNTNDKKWDDGGTDNNTKTYAFIACTVAFIYRYSTHSHHVR